MKILKLIIRNAMRQKLRSFLTALGIAIAILAFGLLSTIIDAYFIGVEASSPTRLITTNGVSLTFPLPISYKEKIANVEGVKSISHGSWFGGTYIDQKNFFAQFAVDPETFLPMYPEFILNDTEKENFLKERNSCIVGKKLAAKHGWEIGDTFRIIGTIYPGDWDFVIRGIYDGRDKATDETSMFFHWKYIDERFRAAGSSREGFVGFFYVEVESEADVIPVSKTVDKMFENSSERTKTETEKEFNLSFISMVKTIITSVRIISVVVIAIILLVLANTMAMTARERISEYAVMKTLGFRPIHLSGIIFGESTFIAMLGGFIGLLISFPIIEGFGIFLTQNMGNFFPVFEMSKSTLLIAILLTISVGILAAIFPTVQIVNMKISDGLRKVG